MANNRMYLYCPPCNETIMLAKHFGTAYTIRASVEAMDAFLSRHQWCGPRDCMACGSQLRVVHEQTESTTQHNAEPCGECQCHGGFPRSYDFEKHGDTPLMHGEGPDV